MFGRSVVPWVLVLAVGFAVGVPVAFAGRVHSRPGDRLPGLAAGDQAAGNPATAATSPTRAPDETETTVVPIPVGAQIGLACLLLLGVLRVFRRRRDARRGLV